MTIQEFEDAFGHKSLEERSLKVECARRERDGDFLHRGLSSCERFADRRVEAAEAAVVELRQRLGLMQRQHRLRLMRDVVTDDAEQHEGRVHARLLTRAAAAGVHGADRDAEFFALALGAQHIPEVREEHMALAIKLTETCYQMYARMKTGLAPEFVQFTSRDLEAGRSAVFNIGRPETVESLFVLWYYTQDPRWREMGWNIFTAFETSAATGSGAPPPNARPRRRALRPTRRAP